MRLGRQIKLYYLTGRGSDRTKMEKKLNDKYPDSVFYLIGDKLFFELDSKNEITWVRYQGFWGKFQSDFGLNRNEIKWLTKYTLEKHLKGKVFPTLQKMNILSLHQHGKLDRTEAGRAEEVLHQARRITELSV